MGGDLSPVVFAGLTHGAAFTWWLEGLRWPHSRVCGLMLAVTRSATVLILGAFSPHGLLSGRIG